MTDVARRHKRVVQVGTQQRSGPHYQKARELVRSGHIGRVVAVRAWFYRNVMPGFGSPPDGDPPPGLDYDLWLGPAPKRPYNPNRSIYHFRWFWDYSGGQMTNLGQHSLDIVHWFLGATAPRRSPASGGRFALQDNGETPDTQDALFEYPGWTATWSERECSRGTPPAQGLEFCGTRGSLLISREGLRRDARPGDRADRCHPAVRRFPSRRRPARQGRTRFGGQADRGRRGSHRRRVRPVPPPCPRLPRVCPLPPRADLGPGGRAPRRNRLSPGEPVAPPGPEDPLGRARETIIGDREAEAMLERPYRAPWDAERKAILATT